MGASALPNNRMELMQGQGQNGSVYDTDEFRLFCHKILPCSKRTPHDWASCPFAHPGEKAKRRNIRTHQYDCEMCPAVVKGEECALGANCPHSHNVFESWLHPQKYRTMMCKDRDKCARAVCFFAHGPNQLRTPTDVGTQQPQHVPTVVKASSASETTLVGMAVDAIATPPAPAASNMGQSYWNLMQDMAQLARATSNGSVMSSTGPSTPTGKSGNAKSPAVAGAAYAAAGAGGVGVLPGGNTSPGSSVASASTLARAAMGSGNTYAQQLQQQQQQQPAASCSNLMEMVAAEQAKLTSGDMSSMQQLLSSLVQEVNASRQEAQRSRTEAAQAQRQLQAFSAAFGGAAGPGAAAVAAVSAGMSVSTAPAGGGTASSNVSFSASPAALLPAGCVSMPLQQPVLMQQQQQQGSYMNMDCSEASSNSFYELSAQDTTNGSSAGSIHQIQLIGMPVAAMDQTYGATAATAMPGQQQFVQLQGNSGPFPQQLVFGGPLQRSTSDSSVAVSAAGPSRFQMQSGQGINMFNSSGSGNNQCQYVSMANPAAAAGPGGLVNGMSILGTSPVSQGQQQGAATTLAAAAAAAPGAAGGMMHQLSGDCFVSACQPPAQHQQPMLVGAMIGMPGVVVSAPSAPMYYV